MSYAQRILEEYYSIEEGKRLRTAAMIGLMGLSGLGAHKAHAQAPADTVTRQFSNEFISAYPQYRQQQQPSRNTAPRSNNQVGRAAQDAVEDVIRNVTQNNTVARAGRAIGQLRDRVLPKKDTEE